MSGGVFNVYQKNQSSETHKRSLAPYGTVVDWPSEQEADRFALRSSDRFDFFPKLGSLACDHDSMQVGIATHYKRPYRTVNMERHYHTEELMVPLTNPIILIFGQKPMVSTPTRSPISTR